MDTTPTETSHSAVIDPAPAATAPEISVAASTPATDPAPKKLGFLASLTGAQSRIDELQNALKAEKDAHAITQATLATAQGRVAEFEAMEKQLEAQATALDESQKAKVEAEATAAQVVAEAPQKVAAQVADVLSTLGVSEEKLVRVSDTPAAKGQEFAHLKGRERAAAAFAAQFAK